MPFELNTGLSDNRFNLLNFVPAVSNQAPLYASVSSLKQIVVNCI